MTTEKHIVHCRSGGKVVIDGDRVEIHLPGPIGVQRKHWCKYLSSEEEARRSLNYAGTPAAQKMLEEAYSAVPMRIYEDPSDD